MAHAAHEHIDTVIVGAGQAGLATACHLLQHRREVAVLEAHARVGESWRRRWDSLRLFTPARYDGLPGMPFPAAPDAFPTKDDMADYLERYAERFAIPVRLRCRVERISRAGSAYLIDTGGRRIEANQVVVATGAFHAPRIPAWASSLDPDTAQLHSAHYRRPDQLPDGPALVVGAGNSGAEIALELAVHRTTWLSGRTPGRLPRAAHTGVPGRVLWWLSNRVLTVDNRLGRAVRRRALAHGAPWVRMRPRDLAAAGVHRVPRAVGTRDGRPVLADGRVLDVSAVVWCTGYLPRFEWIDVPVFGPDGYPIQYRGVVPGAPGLYFVGLPFLHSLGSSTIGGVGRDAEFVARHIASHPRATASCPATAPIASRSAEPALASRWAEPELASRPGDPGLASRPAEPAPALQRP